MKERPILFSGPMVRAILQGRKTQTRRPIKPQPDSRFGDPIWQYGSDWVPNQCVNADLRGAPSRFRCPLGHPGDRLWVRETWTKTQYDKPVYRADSRDRDGYFWPSVANDPKGVLWKPSIHMPRWASRITLEITRVWVERVQDITEEGARADGIQVPRCSCEPCAMSPAICTADAGVYVEAFRDLWQSIYGTWDANPWVWAVEFRRVKP